MPLVFVHGVSVRKDTAYETALASRDRFFCEVMLADAAGKPYPKPVISPYWGGDGVRFRFDMASLPNFDTNRYVPMGVEDAPFGGEVPLTGGEDADTYLARLATTSLLEASDLLFATAVEQHVRQASEPPEGLLALAAACAVYAEANPKPAWLRPEMTNEEFADALVTEAQKAKPGGGPSFQSQGIGDIFNSLQDGITRLKEGAANWVSRQALDAVRETLHGKVALFLGDVFTYLDERGTPQDFGAIVKKVAAALTEGMQARTASDPLIVLGHSLGGVILYDMLTSFQPEANLVPGLHIDRLVTVGSQVGLFEEMKSYLGSREEFSKTSGKKVPMPPAVDRWLNIFDEVDVLSFAAEPIFEGVKDLTFSSRTHVFTAHSAYFLRASFYERLRARLREG